MSRLVFGCMLCKKQLPHTHEEQKPKQLFLIKKGEFSKPRAILLEKLLRETFFPHETGPILRYTKRQP